MAWKRTTGTTKGPDPTKYVTWTDGIVELLEFQGVVTVDGGGQPGGPHSVEELINHLGAELHMALESAYNKEQDEQEGHEADDMSTATYRE